LAIESVDNGALLLTSNLKWSWLAWPLGECQRGERQDNRWQSLRQKIKKPGKKTKAFSPRRLLSFISP
jgi:hypothetical protein